MLIGINFFLFILSTIALFTSKNMLNTKDKSEILKSELPLLRIIIVALLCVINV